jgi:hypothetical protein
VTDQSVGTATWIGLGALSLLGVTALAVMGYAMWTAEKAAGPGRRPTGVDIAVQPPPVPCDHPPVVPQVIADLDARMALGVQRYGVPLQPFNGRDMLQDAYEEALDLAVYLKGCLLERDTP